MNLDPSAKVSLFHYKTVSVSASEFRQVACLSFIDISNLHIALGHPLGSQTPLFILESQEGWSF
jgi:hypothetical protein